MMLKVVKVRVVRHGVMLNVEMYVFGQNWLKLEDYVGKSWREKS